MIFSIAFNNANAYLAYGTLSEVKEFISLQNEVDTRVSDYAFWTYQISDDQSIPEEAIDFNLDDLIRGLK